jgi:hypothetical protein
MEQTIIQKQYEKLCNDRRYDFDTECKKAIKETANGVDFVTMKPPKEKGGKPIETKTIEDIYIVDDEIEGFPHSHGAGAELKKLLSMIGIKATPTCSCNRRALRMDNEGIAWCKKNTEEILEWLAEESKKRKIPFVKFGAAQMLKIAIRRAEQDPRSKP